MATTFDVAPGRTQKKLEDIFGELGDIQTDKFRAQRAPVRSQKLGELAATNRLSSGIAEHSLGELDRNTALGEGEIRGATIGQVGTGILQDDSQDFASEEAAREFERSKALANTIGRLNKPSTLSQIFQGIGSVGSVVGGLYSGNPALVAGGVNGISKMGQSSGGGSDLSGVFNAPDRFAPPNLSLYNPYATGARRYF